MTDDDRATELGSLLAGRSCAVAESCTGGLVSEALARIKGSSEWFRGGLVAYQRRIKYALLGVTPGPVVNARTASEMARGIARLLDATATLAITGAAGPEPQDGAPPGTVFVATFVDGTVHVREHHFDGDPRSVCEQAKTFALAHLATALEVTDSQ
jgi:nicotinamide-nucleotide amidase